MSPATHEMKPRLAFAPSSDESWPLTLRATLRPLRPLLADAAFLKNVRRAVKAPSVTLAKSGHLRQKPANHPGFKLFDQRWPAVASPIPNYIASR
jgi:hypothetical protein